MKYELNAKEARVIGCLLEKQVTTPTNTRFRLTPLPWRATKTNREPVMDMSESEVQQLLDLLLRKHFLRTLSGFGNRVVKYEQRFCNSEFGQLKLSPAELAVIATLLLRGAQTPGELRTRTNRMHEFNDVSEVEQVLQQLATREDGPFVVRLAREPGKRESRFMHLFSGQIDEAPAALESEDDGDLSARVSALENEVSELKRLVQHLLARDTND